MIPFLMWLWARCTGRDIRVKEILLPLSLVGYLLLAAVWIAYTAVDRDVFEHPNQVALWVLIALLWVVVAFSLAFGYTMVLPWWRKLPRKAREKEKADSGEDLIE